MARITHDGLVVCMDCAMLIANGEGTEAHAEKMASQWASEGGPIGLVLSGGPDEEASFSWRECDGCGSTLGGDRLSAVKFAPDSIVARYALANDVVSVTVNPDRWIAWADGESEASGNTLRQAAEYAARLQHLGYRRVR